MQMIFDGLATQGPILVEGPLTGHLPARVLSDSFSNASPRRSEEHTSELQSPCNLVCRLLLEKKKNERLAVTEMWSVEKDRSSSMVTHVAAVLAVLRLMACDVSLLRVPMYLILVCGCAADVSV